MPKHKTKKTKKAKQAMKFECPICHASLRHERIDDGIIIHVISATGEVEELVNKSDGGNRVYCSANEEHAIPHKLGDKVIDLCSCR